MFTTAVALSVFGIAIIVQAVLWLYLLKAGAYWAKVQGATTRRALVISLIVFVSQLVLAPVAIGYRPANAPLAIAFLAVVIAIGIGLLVVLIRTILHTSFWRAVRAWLPTLLTSVVGLPLALLIVQFVTEAFFSPTNGMAPTILGVHFADPCPICGRPAYGSLPERGDPRMESLMICDEFHVHEAKATAATGERDRFMVAKYLRPRRWDVIAFRFPGDPKINYIKRLVGLPGETVFIKDGAVWIDGRRLEPPPSLQGLSYVTEIPHAPPFLDVWGTPERPAVLGQGEYFVLGDFSVNSSDSRLWREGAPGHPSYAVPESYIIGVATHIYWPPSRWRILR